MPLFVLSTGACRHEVVRLPASFEDTSDLAESGNLPTLSELRGQEENWFPFNRHFNQVVSIQGIGWGTYSKGLGFRVVTPHGVPVFLGEGKGRGKKETKDWEGRLVEATGILNKQVEGVVPEGAQGYSESFEYLELSDWKIRPIKKADRILQQIIEPTSGGNR